MKPKLIVVLADLQVPYQDPKYIRSVHNFVSSMRKSRRFSGVEVGQIGDFTDQPETGRWNKGAAGEHAGTFWSGIREAREIINLFHFDWIKVGNHDRRVEDYLEKYAPALLADDGEWNLDTLYQLPSGTRLEREPFRMAPGWIAAHGDEGGLSRIAGMTAFNMTTQWDASVVCGHTHRAGVVSKTVGLPGRRRRISGMEVGHGMVESAATYIKSKSPNWQQGLGVFLVDGRRTYDQLVILNPDRSFSYDGRIFKP